MSANSAWIRLWIGDGGWHGWGCAIGSVVEFVVGLLVCRFGIVNLPTLFEFSAVVARGNPHIASAIPLFPVVASRI